MADSVSDVSIYNQALALIQERRISGFDEEGRSAARLATDNFAPIRDALLRGYKWNFARARKSLAEASTAPDFGFARAFNLPVDSLRINSVDRAPDDRWIVEGRQILTDLSAPLNVHYTRRVTDPAMFDPLFVQLLVHELAVRVAPLLSKNRGISKEVGDALDTLRRTAKRVDASEGIPPSFPESPWIEARL